MRRRPLVLATLSVSVAACGPAAPADARHVSEWVTVMREQFRGAGMQVPVASRAQAYAAVALYEGFAADRRSGLRSLAGQLNGLWKVPQAPQDHPVDGATVAAEAERLVLRAMLGVPSTGPRHAVDSVADAQLVRRRSAGVRRATADRSISHAAALARAILAWADGDGYTATRGRPWRVPAGARWVSQPIPSQSSNGSGVVLAGSSRDRAAAPGADPLRPVEPHWGRLRTFALRHADECAPPRPPEFSERRGSPFWTLAREAYDSAARASPDRRSRLPASVDAVVDRWLRLALPADGDAAEAVATYTLFSIALADATLATWREKYRSMAARPVSYVPRVFDARWTPAIATPNTPEYPSEFATLSGAAARLLQIRSSDVETGDSRAEATGAEPPDLAQLRDELAFSSVIGGINFMPAVAAGLAQGECVGERVAGRLRTTY